MSAAIGQQPAAEQLAEALRRLGEQLSAELREDWGWDNTDYEKGRIAEKQRQLFLLESTLASITTQENDDEPTLD